MNDRALTYVTSRWGEPTQTFVRREARAVNEHGISIDALSVKRPLPVEGISCGWLGIPGLARGLARAIRRHPGRSLRILADVRSAKPANMLPMLAATVTGLAWSGQGLVNHRLHSHFGWVSGAATRAAALHAGVPYSVVYHAFDLHTHGRLDGFAASIATSAHQTFVIAGQDVALVQSTLGVKPEVLRMGVTSEWLEQPISVRPNGRHIVSVGSLVEKKGHQDLVAAMSRVDPTWMLTIVGEGPLRTELQRQIDGLGLTDRIRLVGLLDEDAVRSLMLDADVFALACVEAASGDRDGIPVALMEAMALGLPVVTTDAGAIRELVEGAGFVLNQRQPEELSKAIEQLGDDDQRHQLAEAGRARIMQSWTVERGAQRVADMCDLSHETAPPTAGGPSASSNHSKAVLR